MPLFKNHVEIATALRNDVDKAPIKSKRLKLRTLLAKFGYSKRSDANTAMITQKLNDAGIAINPPITRLGIDWELHSEDWVYLSFATPISDPNNSPGGAFAVAWDYLFTNPFDVGTGIGIVTTTPNAATTYEVAVDMNRDWRDYQLTTVVKSNTQANGGGRTCEFIVRNSSNSVVYQRSKTVTIPDANATKYSLGRLFVANGTGEGFLNGDVAEVIIYLGVLSDRDKAKVEGYLAEKYLCQPGSDFRYTGHYYHQRSGLHLALFRGYDANLGRWINRDPIGEFGGTNMYGYVGNDPTGLWDPLGLIEPNGARAAGHFAAIKTNPIGKLLVDAITKEEGGKRNMRFTCETGLSNPSNHFMGGLTASISYYDDNTSVMRYMTDQGSATGSSTQALVHELAHYLDYLRGTLDTNEASTGKYRNCPKMVEEKAMDWENAFLKNEKPARLPRVDYDKMSFDKILP